jgi:hypothetical protein
MRSSVCAALVFLAAFLGLALGPGRAWDRMPYEAFDRLPVTRIQLQGGVLEVAFTEGRLDLPRQQVLAWIEKIARAVTLYFGRFPVERARLLLILGEGRGLHSGESFGYRGAATKITLGRETREEDLEKDWVLTHEMSHWACPSLAERHHWLEEGLATYVEPLIRLQAGIIRPEKVWLDLVEGLPKGLPRPGDRGLDRTPTWGRTYWGGALYCLLADMAIHQRTDNRHSLRDALAGIVKAGGSIEEDWYLPRMLRIGDETTGVPVLAELYEQMKDKPSPVDLDGLWRKLGISVRGRHVVFDDSAPLAPLRKEIASSP